MQVNPRKMLATPSMSDDSTIDPKNFATIRTTSIVQRQQKEHLQEEMHDQVLANISAQCYKQFTAVGYGRKLPTAVRAIL